MTFMRLDPPVQRDDRLYRSVDVVRTVDGRTVIKAGTYSQRSNMPGQTWSTFCRRTEDIAGLLLADLLTP